MVLCGPPAHVGADLSDQLQRGLRPDGMDLTQISAASEHKQRSADVEGGRMLRGGGLGAWRGQRGAGCWAESMLSNASISAPHSAICWRRNW